MFTGLIERTGTLRHKRAGGAGAILEIAFGPEPFELRAGDSVAVDGLCLTAVSLSRDSFTVDVSRESLSRSTLGALAVGAMLNLERALALGSRLGGHLVTGHIDDVGEITALRPEGDFTRVEVSAPAAVLGLVVEKGSVALDGISLTVNGVGPSGFWMTVIPETLARTTLGRKKAGDRVNLETDIIGKYVARLLAARTSPDDRLLKKLADEGFI